MFEDFRGPSRARRRNAGLLAAAAMCVTALVGTGAGSVTYAEGIAPSAGSAPLAEPVSDVAEPAFASVAPDRLADTRTTGETVDDDFAGDGPIAAGGRYEIDIAGRGSVPADATGVVVELTAIRPAAPGYFTADPCAVVPPNASSLNYTVGVNVANEIFVDLSDAGSLCVFSSVAAHMALDVVGYVSDEDVVEFVAPARLADSRLGTETIDGRFEGFGRTSAGGTTTIRVSGRATVPSTATSAILNVAAVRPTSTGYLSVDACVPGVPTASSLNFVAGVNRANELIVELDDLGNVCIYTSEPIDLIVDVVGYVEDGSDLVSVTPSRFVESRPGFETVDGANQGGGEVAAGMTTRVQIAGRGEVPIDAASVIVNVGAIRSSADGFLTLDGCAAQRPNVSALNYTAGVNGANEVVVKLNSDGELCIYNSGATNLILDVVGYVTPLISMQILSFNDFHGHVESNTAGSLTAGPAGGAEFLSAKLSEVRTDGYSVTAAAGDLIGGSPAFSGLFHDEPAVEALNVMELDVSGVGNHEFDEGVTELLRMQNGGCHPVDGCYFPSEPFAGADFQWLSANVVETATNETPLPEYWVEDVSGIKVGFIGMTLEGTDALVAAAGIAGYDFLDEAETANALVPILQADGVEAIVVLLHEGGSQTPPPGELDACVDISGPVVAIHDALDPAIDVLITGHTHLPYNCRLDDSAGNPRIVTSAYSFGRVVTDITLVLDRRTGDVEREPSTAVNHGVIQSELTADANVTAVIDKWTPLFESVQGDEVGQISADINRGGVGGSDRGVESAAGNLVADAHRAAAGADVAFMNPGGLRSDLTFAQSGTEGDGVVTFAEAFTFQPFGNNVLRFPMTGAQIVSVLEEQCQPTGSSRPFLHLGVSDGFTYDLAKTIAAGTCTSITVSNVLIGGVPIDLGATYTVAANVFLADGGDNFTTFTEVDPSDRADLGNDVEALRDYFAASGIVDPPSTDRVNEL